MYYNNVDLILLYAQNSHLVQIWQMLSSHKFYQFEEVSKPPKYWNNSFIG